MWLRMHQKCVHMIVLSCNSPMKFLQSYPEHLANESKCWHTNFLNIVSSTLVLPMIDFTVIGRTLQKENHTRACAALCFRRLAVGASGGVVVERVGHGDSRSARYLLFQHNCLNFNRKSLVNKIITCIRTAI